MSEICQEDLANIEETCKALELQNSYYENNKNGLTEIINENAILFREKQALINEREVLSYNDLNKLSLKLALLLQKKNIQKGSRVAVYLDRSFELIVSLMSILYQGAVYIPINSSSVKSRVSYILADAAPDLIITKKEYMAELDNISLPILCMDCEMLKQQELKRAPTIFTYSHSDPVYIIYTSGSTGDPKGVEISHGAVLNRLVWMIHYLSLNHQDVFCSKTPIGFDVSIWELLLPLLLGSTNVLVSSDDSKDIQLLKSIIEQNKVTICHFVPAMLDIFLENSFSSLMPLKKVICSGEELKKPTEKKFFDTLKCQLFNFYGPTEAAIDVTAWKCSVEDQRNFVPIGYPIWNTQIHILDKYHVPVKEGEVGEICISGVCLASRYINKDELTKEKFALVNLNNQQIRIYKTGDMGRKLIDGSIQFLGREDEQIKINGQRIELAEIEYYFKLHPGVKTACVVYRANEPCYKLQAFIILNKNTSQQDLFIFLKEYLPPIFIPKSITFLDSLPISENGKVDKRALKKFLPSSITFAELIPLTTTTEKEIANIWADVFSITPNELGKNHHFFDDLGGHSLMVPAMINKCINYYGINSIHLRYHDIIEYPTLEKFSKKIEYILQLPQKNLIEQKIGWPFVYLNDVTEGTPIFIFHPVGGTVFCYHELAKSIRGKHPVIGIQDPSIDRGEKLFTSFKEMAEYYKQAICHYFPCERYLLAGLSFGGNLAVEIASYLENEGYQVDFIGVIDGWANLAEDPDALQESWQLNHANKTKYLPMAINDERWLSYTWERIKFLGNHHIKCQVSKITLFKAKDVDYHVKNDPFNYWEKFSQAPIKRFLIPGAHESVIQKPFVKELAHAINQCLLECQT